MLYIFIFRCRKRLSTLLHTHVILIFVCTLAALDAAFVIGQIICDILIMKGTLEDSQTLSFMSKCTFQNFSHV